MQTQKTALPALDSAFEQLIADRAMTQRELSAVAADEIVVQDAESRSEGPAEIISEVAFIGLPGDVGWLGFRRATM